MKYLLAGSLASLTTAMLLPQAAFAQSTGSVDFDENEIVVTGVLQTSVGGVEIPDSPKAKQALDEEAIRRQRPGQTVNDIVNLVPGVSFQNNDPWGSSGGSFTIRGFSSDRISQTLDGLPLNDSGNYALYTNQQVDPEVLEQVNVNLGVTDVDSPTASAVGGTINIRTRVPSSDMGFTSTITYGDVLASGKPDPRPYKRVFAMMDTGEFTSFGTKAFISASYTGYENPFNNYGTVKKLQTNGRIYQPLGDNGDFISIAGHYNQNRNNFFGSFAPYDFPTTKKDRFYNINYPCTVETPVFGTAQSDNNCGAEFDRRWNPSNTGNIRGSSKFTLTDNLVLTIDPSYQYVKANGGGDEELLEGRRNVGGNMLTGFISGRYYYGRDLNGDGDTLDEVTGHDPSQTRTHRFGVITNLVYDINPDHRVRIAYTWDRANHRQTGSTSVALNNGDILDVFPINNPLVTADGFVLNKRDRQSYAILHQISGEYRGIFGDLTAVLGLRLPFFTRELDQRCYTTSAGGFLDCVGGVNPAYEAARPYSYDYATNTVSGSAPPQQRTYKYDKLLPNIGFTYNITNSASIFANYAKGLSVPGTDPLYDSLYFPADAPGVQPQPETTDSFDGGFRFRSGSIQAQVAGWFTRYDGRLASSYDALLDERIYRNLGRVDKYGVDASIAWRPSRNSLIYVFGSVNKSEIKDNIIDGVCGASDIGVPGNSCTAVGQDRYLLTAGKRESGAPTYMIGARGQYSFGAVDVGVQVKRTGKRYLNDVNQPLYAFGSEAYNSTFGAYTLVDFDIRWNVTELSTGGDLAVQFNMTNVFDELYVGGFGGTLNNIWSFGQFVQIGAPRAASISVIAGF